MTVDLKVILAEMDGLVAEYRALRKASQYDDCSDQEDVVITSLNTRLAAAIERFAMPASRYLKALEQVVGQWGPNIAGNLAPLVGVLSALRDDTAAGHLTSLRALLHADLFGDFLDMAQHLLQEGYKDAAAVLAGGVLEEHLRKLCAKNGVPAIDPAGRPRKADAMNADLAGATAYSKLDQKNVTAWLGLRNDAAHGNYAAYVADQVGLLIQAVRDFVTRVPA